MTSQESDVEVVPQADLEALARRGRWLVLKTVADSQAGHVGGPMCGSRSSFACYISGPNNLIGRTGTALFCQKGTRPSACIP